MTLPRWTNALGPWGWVAATVALLVLLLVVWYVLTAPGRERQKAAGAHAGAVAAAGTAAGAKDAMGVVIGNQKSEASIDAQTAENTNAILSQSGASVVVAPDVDAAGRRAICLRKSAASLPECQRLRQLGAGNVAGRGSSGSTARW